MPGNAALIKQHCVAVAIDSYRVGSGKDAEAKFAARAYEGVGGGGNNNLTLVSADGKVIGSCLREPLAKLLEKWNQLPAEARKPGAVQVPELGPRDPLYAWADPPPGGLTLKVFARNVKCGERGELLGDKSLFPSISWLSTDAYRDSLWITQAEWQALVPGDPKKGDSFAAPRPVRDRLFQFCLFERYRTFDRPWSRAEIRSGELTLTVQEVSAANVSLKLQGDAVIATDPDVRKAKHGYEGSLLGYLNYDRSKKVFTRIDLLALGENWWNEKHTGAHEKEFANVRLGRITVGVAFELAAPGSGFHHLAPGWHSSWARRKDYFTSGVASP